MSKALYVLFVAVVTALFVVACTPQLRPVAPELSKLRFYVAQRAAVHGGGHEFGALETALPDAIENTLAKAGYLVVTEEAKEHDVSVVLSATVEQSAGMMQYHDAQGRVVPVVTARMRFEGSGELLGEVDERSPGAQLEYLANSLVNKMNESARLVAFAKSHKGAGPAVAAQDAPAAATAPAGDRDARATTRAPALGPLVAGAAQKGAYALVIGIERYRDVPPPTGARRDAEQFAELAKRTLGVPEENVRIALDDRATKGDIEKQLRWLKANVEKGGRIYFFFSGHGSPDAREGTPYLLPFDGDPKFVDQTAIPLAHVMSALAETEAKDVLAIVDSCFSGAGGRSVLPPGARPLVRVKDAQASLPPHRGGRIAVLSASAGSEISGPVPGGEGGLFTKYVLTGLGNGAADTDGDGRITLKELHDYVKPNVARDARRDNREQTPTLTTGADVGDPGQFVVTGLKR